MRRNLLTYSIPYSILKIGELFCSTFYFEFFRHIRYYNGIISCLQMLNIGLIHISAVCTWQVSSLSMHENKTTQLTLSLELTNLLYSRSRVRAPSLPSPTPWCKPQGHWPDVDRNLVIYDWQTSHFHKPGGRHHHPPARGLFGAHLRTSCGPATRAHGGIEIKHCFMKSDGCCE